MPSNKLQNLDEEYSYDICPEFSGGMASAPRANLLERNQAALIQNMEFDTQGIMRTRRGTRQFQSTAQPGFTGGQTVYLPTQQVITAAAGANLIWCLAPNVTQVVPGGSNVFASGAFISSAHGQLGAYYCDGQNLVVFCDGVTATVRPEIPIGALLAWHTNRLFVAGIPGRPHTLKCSGILDDRTWSFLFSIDVGSEDGDEIVALLPFQDNLLIVFKRNSVWIVNCDPQARNEQGQLSASAWVTQSVPGQLGCVCPRTVAVVGNDVWYQSQDGVRVLQRAQFVTAQFNVIDPSSTPIRDYFRRFNRSADMHAACATSFNGLYLISIPLDGSLVNSVTLVYRQITKSWQGVWTLGIQAFITDTFFQPNRLMMCTTDGLMREYLDYYQDFQADPSCFQDAVAGGSPVGVRSIVRSRAMIFGEIVSPKLGQFWECEFYQSRSAQTNISGNPDSSLSDTLLLQIDTQAQPALFFPIPLPSAMPQLGVKKRASNLVQLNVAWRELQMVVDNVGDLLPISFRYTLGAAAVQPPRYEIL